MRLGATTTAVITPFRNGMLDIAALDRLAERQVHAGVDGLAVCTPIGEGPTLTTDERNAVIRTCVRVAAGRVPIIVATGTNDTATTIDFTRQAEDLGAAAALVTVPYYSKPGQSGIVHHFERIGLACKLPLIVDNNPSRTATDLTADTLSKLSAIPFIAGLANTGGGMAALADLPQHLRDRFILLCGNDADALAFLASGGDGIISAGANVHPRLFASLQQAARARNISAAAALDDRLFPLIKAIGADGDPSVIKHALHVLLGTNAEVRLPLVELEPDARVAISDALIEVHNYPRPRLSI